LAQAIALAKPAEGVGLSSVGGTHASGLGLISQLHIMEETQSGLAAPTAILRPAWVMKNSLWDVAPAREAGGVASFLLPLDRPFPMVATDDIGRVAADILAQSWTGRRVIEIEGPKRCSQNEIASLLGVALGRPVTATEVPRASWEVLLKSQGSMWPTPRIEMLDGFNPRWIDFEGGQSHRSDRRARTGP